MRKITDRIKHAKEKWRREGFWLWAWRNFLIEVWPLFWDKKTILWMEKNLAGDTQLVEARIQMEIKVVSDPDDDLSPMLQKAEASGWGNPSFVRDALREGNECYVAVNGHRILAYQWVATRSVTAGKPRLQDVNCEVELSSNEVYLFRAFTLPQYRGRRLIGALKTRAMRDFQLRGYRITSVHVRDNNNPNLRSLARLGFTTCRAITLYRIFRVLKFYVQKHISPCSATIGPKARGRLP